jgi:hypothetical protein
MRCIGEGRNRVRFEIPVRVESRPVIVEARRSGVTLRRKYGRASFSVSWLQILSLTGASLGRPGTPRLPFEREPDALARNLTP